jgi:purine-binding chemotaxis protein CheW
MLAETIQAARRFLTFVLDTEAFGVDIAKVREVLGTYHVTSVPCTPEHVRGVINLRGNVVPVLDLKCKFGLGRTEDTTDSCVVIVAITVESDELIVGFLADAVREVLDVAGEDILPPPAIGARLSTEFLTGMGRRGDEFVLLLDIDQAFGSRNAMENFTGTQG